MFAEIKAQDRGSRPGGSYKCAEDNFPTQMVREPTGEGIRLELLIVNRDGLVVGVNIGGHLGHSDYKMRDFSFAGEANADQQNCHLELLAGRLSPLSDIVQQRPLGGRRVNGSWKKSHSGWLKDWHEVMQGEN